MENLIEKLKSVDKKVWIGVGIGAAVLIILIVALVIGLGNKKPTGGNQGDSQSGTQYGTETEGGVTEVFGTEDVTEVLGTEMATETEKGTETEMTESESQNQGGTTSNVTITKPEDVGGVEQKPVTTTPDGEEIFGLGSKSEPYEVTPNLDTMSVTTVEVPAGKTLYYNIYRVGGMYLNISDPDLYVIDSAGKRHDSSFTVEGAMSNEYVSFQIGNKGSSNKTFTIKFSNLKGTQANPEVITDLSGSKSLSAGDVDGWYYKYTATQSGTIRFYISYTQQSDIIVTYSPGNDPNQGTVSRNFTADGNGNDYVELSGVAAGDVISIQIVAIPDAFFEYPATEITWRGEYVQ